MRPVSVLGLASVVLLGLAGCGNGDLRGTLTPIDRQQAAGYTVTALNARGALRVGTTSLVLEFHRRADDQLADPGSITASLWMPMAGMPPHFGSVAVEPLDQQPGRYRVTASDVSMAGTWFLVLTYADGQRAQLTLPAQ